MAETKRQIEDYIMSELSSDDQKTARSFVEYLKNSGAAFIRDTGACWKDKIYYWAVYEGECVCFIAIRDPDEQENRWTVWSADMSSAFLENYPFENEIKELAWKRIDLCRNCGSCGGGKRKTVFGREFDRVCGCTFRIDNPTAEDLPFMKKMAEIRKEEILNARFNGGNCGKCGK